MPWMFSAGPRMQALDEKVEALSDRLEEVLSRVVHVTADLDRLSSDIDGVRQRLDAEASDRRDQANFLAAVRETVIELQAGNEKARDVVAALQADRQMALDVSAGQASLLDGLQEKNLEQSRSLDQIRVDVTRIERQAAADLAELRTTNTALARLVLNTRDGGSSASSQAMTAMRDVPEAETL